MVRANERWHIIMGTRKEILSNSECYHIFSRSIAKFVVFNTPAEYLRFIDLMRLYRFQNFQYRYSDFIDLEIGLQSAIRKNLEDENEVLVKIIAYCLMPTHIHLIVQQVVDDGISKFIARVLNGYSRFFNTKHKRLGPLWSSRFKSVRVLDDDQMLHLTRYVHLNPTSANIVSRPEHWQFSSSHEFIGEEKNVSELCNFTHLMDFESRQYKKFVEDHKSYQRDLAKIKKLIIDDYTG